MHPKRFIGKLNIPTVAMSLIVALIVSLTGSYISYRSSKKLLLEEREFEASYYLIEKRLNLIDRMASLVGQQPGVQELWERQSKNLKDNNYDVVLSEKLGGYNGEYYSVLFQTSFFFWGKNQKNIQRLKDLNEIKPWWEIPQNQYIELLENMKKELLININN